MLMYTYWAFKRKAGLGADKSLWVISTVCGKYLEGENIGEFGEFVAIRQIFTLQMSANVLVLPSKYSLQK